MEKTVTVDLDKMTVNISIKDLRIEDATNLSVIIEDIAENVKNALSLSKTYKRSAEWARLNLLGKTTSQEKPQEDP